MKMVFQKIIWVKLKYFTYESALLMVVNSSQLLIEIR
jgi:hypothetical protein